MEEENNTRSISIKNYIYIILIFVAVIFMGLYFLKWYKIKKDESTFKNYLVEHNYVTNQINLLEELKDVLTENSSRLILYITYRKDNKIYNMEKKYKSSFENYDLDDIFYLFDITDIKNENKNYKTKINNYLDINVTNYPVVIYYENGQISSYKKINSSKDFNNFIKKVLTEKK